MSDTFFLQQLFQQQIDHSSQSSSLDQVVQRFLTSTTVSDEDLEKECQWCETQFSTEKTIENWKRLLTIQLLNFQPPRWMASTIRLFENQPWNQSSQYFRALVALNHALAKMSIPEVGVHLLESGAALLDLAEYAPWLSFPQTPQHLEFGLFLCLLALITQREDLKGNALKVIRWQLNTLDGQSSVLEGLFVRERDGNILTHDALSYLLFRAASSLEADTLWITASQEALKRLNKNSSKKIAMDPLWPVVEKWLEVYPPLEVTTNSVLSDQIYDPSTALVGYRSATQHAICTLHGSYTGLGSLRQHDVEIVSYGPQYLPLSDCRGFGIEGNALSDQGIRRSTIDSRRQAFTLKGCTRLVDQPANQATGMMGQFQGIWLEVTQEFKRPHFYLQANYLGLDGWKDVAFSFFVKAKACHIQSQQSLLPGTLERYEGSAHALTFDGQHQSAFDLRLLAFEGTMQVIPLGGGSNFWGANFLVAYLMTPEQRHYQWHVVFKS
jgi:hypothetical protein